MNTLDAWFLELLAISWRAGLLILGLIGVRWVVRRHLPAGMVFALWLLLAGVLLVPWRAPLPAGWGQRMMTRFFPTKPAMVMAVEPAPVVQMHDIRELAKINPGPGVVTAAGQDVVPLGDHATLARAWFEYALLIWLFVAAVLVVIRAAAAVSFRRRLRRDAQVVELRVERVLERCGVKMGLRRLPEVKTTRLVGGPALCGLWRPWLLMPPGLADRLSGPELEWVIRHELAHLRRRDLWAQALLQAACIVHWFNPLVWWAARLARHDCELACDATVLRQSAAEEREDYGCVLLKVMRVNSGRCRVPAALGISESKRQLKRRIGMIADHRATGKGRALAGGLLLGTFAVVGYTQEQEIAAGKPAIAVPAVANAHTVTPSVEATMAESTHYLGAKGMHTPLRDPAITARIAAEEKARNMWIANAKLELRAVGSVGGVPVAVIDVYGDPHVVVDGNQLFRQSIERIDVAAKQVTIRPVTMGGSQTSPVKILRLEHPRDVEFPVIPPDSVEFMMNRNRDAAAIYREMMPSEVVIAWPKLNLEGKEAILMSYLRAGLVVNIIGDPNGRYSSSSTGQLFAKQIRQRNRARMEAFLASLSPEQRADFHDGATLAINFTLPPDERAKIVARSKALQADQAKVVAELSPEQRKLYDAWQGVTH